MNVDILYDGKKYSIYHLSAHNPELCIDEIVVAKVCAKVENLEWSGGEVSGTLYVGVGVVIVGTKYFKVTDFDFDYDEDEEAAATEAKALDDAKSPNLFGCNTKYTDCTSCVEATEVLIYPCYWCEIDNACHDVGSIESACSPPSADDKCVSLSSLSNCAHKDVGECPTAAKAKALDDDANSVCSICEEAVNIDRGGRRRRVRRRVRGDGVRAVRAVLRVDLRCDRLGRDERRGDLRRRRPVLRGAQVVRLGNASEQLF